MLTPPLPQAFSRIAAPVNAGKGPAQSNIRGQLVDLVSKSEFFAALIRFQAQSVLGRLHGVRQLVTLVEERLDNGRARSSNNRVAGPKGRTSGGTFGVSLRQEPKFMNAASLFQAFGSKRLFREVILNAARRGAACARL